MGIQKVVRARKQDTLKNYYIAEFPFNIGNLLNLLISNCFNINKYNELIELLLNDLIKKL